jgi:hypothetical protein
MKTAITALLFAAALQAADHRVIVAGLGGEPDYESRFTLLAQEAGKLMPGSQEVLIGAKSTKANVKAVIEKIAAEAKPEDSLTVLLIGHGTYDALNYKFNLVGPDLTADELKGWLDKVQARQLVVIATSASGAAAEVLRANNRVVVTATKSGTEKNAVVFGRYWVEALRDNAADTDKNESISAAEAFNYAKQKTAAFYETQKRLATEHPVLDDSGTGGRYVVVRFGAAQKAMNDPQKRALAVRKEEIEGAIDKLKFEKAAMPINEYKQKLNALLLELARLQEEIDK